ncbi:energy transducer TonB [Methylosinus sp. PW1]|uniref:energy transducer TonB n=1 Tax=Methylosinus sp. PW1 TaxID=107636 RepID=UPI001FD895E3|nr:energy transducer TonB [Methylosinus sp. PW1]
MMKRATLVLLLALPAAGALATEADKPGASAAPAAAAPATTASSGLSQSKFLGLLYSEIAKRTPMTSPAGPGSATASFHIDAAGKIDKVTIAQSSSPKHADIVRKILSGLIAPPPPGGSFEGSQRFNFH